MIQLVNAVPDPIVLPTMFNDDRHVELPDTNKFEEYLLNYDVDVLFKILINNIEYVLISYSNN